MSRVAPGELKMANGHKAEQEKGFHACSACGHVDEVPIDKQRPFSRAARASNLSYYDIDSVFRRSRLICEVTSAENNDKGLGSEKIQRGGYFASIDRRRGKQGEDTRVTSIRDALSRGYGEPWNGVVCAFTPEIESDEDAMVAVRVIDVPGNWRRTTWKGFCGFVRELGTRECSIQEFDQLVNQIGREE